MSDRSYEVDKYGTYYSRENRSRSPSSYSDRSDASYRSRSGSRSHNYKYRQRSYSRSRSRSSSRPRSSRRDWIVPTNPLLRGDDSHHHHHRHHHHHHHHRHRSHSPKRLTVADKKERWGHELYIENVVLNPEPEPPRLEGEWQPPQEKWISKAGGVAIFTSRPTSASSYQGRHSSNVPYNSLVSFKSNKHTQ